MSKIAQHPPRIDAQGNHWEQHGMSVYQADAAWSSAEDRASAAPIPFRHALPKSNGVSLNLSNDEAWALPAWVGVDLAATDPEIAERIAENVLRLIPGHVVRSEMDELQNSLAQVRNFLEANGWTLPT